MNTIFKAMATIAIILAVSVTAEAQLERALNRTKQAAGQKTKKTEQAAKSAVKKQKIGRAHV